MLIIKNINVFWGYSIDWLSRYNGPMGIGKKKCLKSVLKLCT